MIVKMLFGSHLYGTQTPSSDTDYKGVAMPSVRDIALGRVPGHVLNQSTGDQHSRFEKTYSPYKPRRVPGPDGSLPLTEEEMKEFNEKFYPDTLTLKVSASGLFILRNAEKHIVNNYKAVQYLLNIFNL